MNRYEIQARKLELLKMLPHEKTKPLSEKELSIKNTLKLGSIKTKKELNLIEKQVKRVLGIV